MGLPDHGGPEEVPGGLALALVLLGLALEGQGLLELPGDVQPVEVSGGPDHGLQRHTGEDDSQINTCYSSIVRKHCRR